MSSRTGQETGLATDKVKRLFRKHEDKLRFLAVGAFNTVLGYGLFALLLFLLDDPLRSLSSSKVPSLAFAGAHYYLVVQWLNWALCVPPNTLAMKYFAFRSKGSALRQVGRAYLVYLPVQILSFALLLVAVRVLHLSPLLGQLVAIAGALVATYLGHKKYTFGGVPLVTDVAPSTDGAGGPSRVRRLMRRENLLVLLLLAGILVFRVAWVMLVEPPLLVKDSAFYDSAAHWFMGSGTFAVSDALNPSAWVMPGYSFFLSVVYWLFGGDPSNLLAVRIVQAALSVLTIVVLYRVALRFDRRGLGLAVVLFASLYPPFTRANGYILTEVLYTFLLCLVVLFGVRLLEEASCENASSFAILLALAAYVRPAAVLWGVVPFLFLVKRVPFRRLAALSAVALIVFCVCMSPWWIRNAQVYDRFVPLSTSSSDPLLRGTYSMFYQGDDTGGVPEGVLIWTSAEMQDMTAEAELQADSHYKELALARLKDQLVHHPAQLLLGRLHATFGSFRSPYLLPQYSKPVKEAIKYSQLLVLLVPAIVAIWAKRKDKRVLLLGSLPVLVGLIYAAILIDSRYVLPLMPVILLLAAMGWLHIFDWGSRKRGAHDAARTPPPGPGSG
jgi:4-amino-4-deoxy-L-arabinose transferase-like glycosyltransferase/putative flippase GtrA